MGTSTPAADLLARADAERAAGRGEAAARLYEEAIRSARESGDLDAWLASALSVAAAHVFGTDPGRLPAELHDLLGRLTRDADRTRVAAALSRCWSYSGRADRAAVFAAEAQRHAERTGDATLVADALDAVLACHWGPDDLGVRIATGARLDDVTAHVLDPDVRLQAHLWGLQVACESLNLPSLHRHLHALERLGEESPRARFFATTRRLMYDLLRGRTDTAPQLLAAASGASGEAGLADGWMVVEAQRGYTALQAGDIGTCAVVAAHAEEFARSEGVVEVAAEAAWLWVGARRPDRAAALVMTFGRPVLEDLPRDVNWLLTMQCVLEAALACDAGAVAADAARLLAPYAGRAVFNAGAVAFHGVTDDTLARAAAALGEPERAGRLREQALATYAGLGATWWHDRLRLWAPPSPAPSGEVHLHPAADGLWLVGAAPGTAMRPLRGYAYLRVLLGRPGRAVAAVDLVTGGRGVLQPDAGPALDDRALAAYRQRLVAIDDEVAEAEGWSDAGRLEALRGEREALLDQLSSSVGLGGRPRRMGSTQERARVAVTKAIGVAIDRITRVDERLGAHLAASVRTGVECRYEPGDGAVISWVLS